MNIWLKITIFMMMSVIVGTTFASRVSASVKFSNIKISEIENGTAKVEWATDIETKAVIYYGISAKNLDKSMGYSLYDYNHESTLTGLKKNKTYFFKIVAISEFEKPSETESFLQTFSTKSMKKEETVQPTIMESKILDVTSGAIAISWMTNEKTKATVYYREESQKNYAASSAANFDYYHIKAITGLKPGKRYYIKITAADASGNKSTAYLYTNTRTGKTSELKITNIEPLSYDEKMIFPRSAILRWKTNRITKSSVSYGTDPSRMTVVASDPSPQRELDHEIRLVNLEPEKTYFYKISATDYFSGKAVSKIMSFATPPPRKEIKSGSIVKGSGYKVYVIEGNNKRWIKTAEAFLKLGYKWNWIEKVDDHMLSEYKDASDISSAAKHPDGTLVKYASSPAVYLIENGKKRPISSAETFTKMGFDWSRIITISKKETYKTGEYL